MNFQAHSQIDSMRYGTMRPKDIDTIAEHTVDNRTALGRYFEDRRAGKIDCFPFSAPCSNSSAETVVELNRIVQRMTEASQYERDFAVRVDDLRNHYEFWADMATRQTGVKYDWQWFNTMVNRGNGLILYAKSYYNRMRPYQLGPILGKSIVPIVSDPQTPSYPSGHAFDAGMFASALSARHPEFHMAFVRLADKIADSRIVGGVHFPSDCRAGIMLGQFVIQNRLVDIPR
jgi:hypothetical protein